LTSQKPPAAAAGRTWRHCSWTLSVFFFVSGSEPTYSRKAFNCRETSDSTAFNCTKTSDSTYGCHFLGIIDTWQLALKSVKQ
jgi:hypothetical protein